MKLAPAVMNFETDIQTEFQIRGFKIVAFVDAEEVDGLHPTNIIPICWCNRDDDGVVSVAWPPDRKSAEATAMGRIRLGQTPMTDYEYYDIKKYPKSTYSTYSEV